MPLRNTVFSSSLDLDPVPIGFHLLSVTCIVSVSVCYLHSVQLTYRTHLSLSALIFPFVFTYQPSILELHGVSLNLPS